MNAFLRTLRAAFLENLGLKVISLAFALGFYAFLNGPQTAQRTVQVSVVVLLPKDPQRVLLTQPPATVRATLHGIRSAFDDLRAEDLGTLQLDLRRGTEAYGAFDASGLNLPPGVHVELDPPGIALSWDDMVTRNIPVQVTVTGQPIAGYAVLGQPIADPRTITAHGPKSAVDTIQYVTAEAFDVGGLTEGEYQRKVPVSRPPPQVTYEESTSSITVTIGRARLERVYVKLPLHVLGVAHGTAIPNEVDVKVEGPPEIVGILRPEQIVATVDVRPSGEDTKQPGSARLPVIATVEGCTTQVIPSSAVVKW